VKACKSCKTKGEGQDEDFNENKIMPGGPEEDEWEVKPHPGADDSDKDLGKAHILTRFSGSKEKNSRGRL
jgi:hypothetical protein